MDFMISQSLDNLAELSLFLMGMIFSLFTH